MADLDAYPFLRHVKSPITAEQLSPLDPRCNVVQFDSPLIGVMKHLELWMVKGLQDLDAIGKTTTLQNLFLQALKNVTTLPSFRNLRSLRRVALDTMKGLTDLSPIADAPGLEELLVVAANQFQPDDFKPFSGHSTLKSATIGLGSIRKNELAQQLLGLPKCNGFKSQFIYK